MCMFHVALWSAFIYVYVYYLEILLMAPLSY